MQNAARTFEYKEPGTIEWIESLEKNEKLLDVEQMLVFILYLQHL